MTAKIKKNNLVLNYIALVLFFVGCMTIMMFQELDRMGVTLEEYQHTGEAYTDSR